MRRQNQRRRVFLKHQGRQRSDILDINKTPGIAAPK
jgi:hypothetical protein